MRGTQFAQLTAFVAVAEHRSFTKAATYLGLKAPSLSQSIRGLEETFGVRLLNRTTRSVTLTEVGEQLLGHLSPVLEGVEKAVDAVNEFRDKPTGTLRLTVHPIAAVSVIAPLVARLSAEYPAIRLEIFVDVKHRDLVSERFDAGIRPGDGIAQDMIAVPIGGSFRPSTVASPDYLAAHSPPVVPEDLSSHNCIGYGGDDDISGPWRFQKAGQEVEIPVAGSLSVNDLPLALRAGLDGVGIVQLPEAWVSPLVAQGKLVQLLEDWSPRCIDFCLFYSSRRHIPLKLRTLIDFLRKESKQVVQTERSQNHRTTARLYSISAHRRLNEAPSNHASGLVQRDMAAAVCPRI